MQCVRADQTLRAAPFRYIYAAVTHLVPRWPLLHVSARETGEGRGGLPTTPDVISLFALNMRLLSRRREHAVQYRYRYVRT